MERDHSSITELMHFQFIYFISNWKKKKKNSDHLENAEYQNGELAGSIIDLLLGYLAVITTSKLTIQ